MLKNKFFFNRTSELLSITIITLLLFVVPVMAVPFDLTFEGIVEPQSLPPGITTGDSIIFAIRVDNGNTSFKDQTWGVNDYISATVTLQNSTITYTATVDKNVLPTAGTPSTFITNDSGAISQVGDWSVNSDNIIFSDSLGNNEENSGKAGFTINETNSSPFFFVNGPGGSGSSGSIRVSFATDSASSKVVSVPEEGFTLTMLGAVFFLLIGFKFAQSKRVQMP